MFEFEKFSKNFNSIPKSSHLNMYCIAFFQKKTLSQKENYLKGGLIEPLFSFQLTTTQEMTAIIYN